MAWTDYYVDLSLGSGGSGSSGDPWGSFTAAVTGLGTVASPTRVFVRGNGSISENLTINPAGTSETNPVWWVGCTGSGTTWTDIGDGTNTKPILTQGSFSTTFSVANQIVSNISFNGSGSSATIKTTASNIWIHRCKIIATGPGAGANAISCSTSGPIYITGSYFTSTSSANCINATVSIYAMGNFTENGLDGISCAGNINATMFNVIDSPSRYGIIVPGNSVILNNTIRGGSGAVDGIRLTSTQNMVANNLIVDCTGVDSYAVRNAGSSTSQIRMLNNGYYNCSLSVSGIIDSSSIIGFGNTSIGGLGLMDIYPFNNVSSNDYTLISGNAIDGGFPGRFEGI